MSLLVLFRSRLEWCNYTCSYCPWNANLTRVEGEQFREDERRVMHVVEQVGKLSRPVEFFITPKAEYLVLPYWREAVRRLLSFAHVNRVTVQTNLSFDVQDFVQSVEAKKLALWTTYHPGEVDEARTEELYIKWEWLRETGIPFSVGVVGLREHLFALRGLRERLHPDIYVWVNSYKREIDYYREEERQAIRDIDPLFDLNDQHYLSLGQPCTAGQRAVYLDDEGDLRRCFFVGSVLGNLFRDGWATLDSPASCPVRTCHCYVGHMHMADLDFRGIYGASLAARVPLGWPTIKLDLPRLASERLATFCHTLNRR